MNFITENDDYDIKYKQKKHSIIINSFDRDWLNTTDTPYNFRIKFLKIRSYIIKN